MLLTSSTGSNVAATHGSVKCELRRLECHPHIEAWTTWMTARLTSNPPMLSPKWRRRYERAYWNKNHLSIGVGGWLA